MRIRLATLTASLVVVLNGCVSYHINDNDVMMPDRLTGYHVKNPFTQKDLNALIPQAKLQEEFIDVSPNIRVAGLSIVRDDAPISVLYFLGGGDHVDSAIKSMARLAAGCPMNVSLFDYRGFGRSSGEHSMKLMKEDALLIYDRFREKTKTKLIVHGYSLGSFMASHVAQHRPIDGLILQATANTMEAIINTRIPAFVRTLVRFELNDGLRSMDNVEALSGYMGAGLLISGEQDDQTPVPLGRLVFDAIPSQEKRFLLVKDGTHSNLLHSEQVKTAYCKFLQQSAKDTNPR